MLRFVSMVYLDGVLLALTEGGAVWQFPLIATRIPGVAPIYEPMEPAWTKVADGPLHKMGGD
jgi:hypothetical protein